MSDEKKKKILEDVRKRGSKIFTEGIDFTRCPIHGVNYPKGGQCPICEKGKKK